jgi:hypothetical protein
LASPDTPPAKSPKIPNTSATEPIVIGVVDDPLARRAGGATWFG